MSRFNWPTNGPTVRDSRTQISDRSLHGSGRRIANDQPTDTRQAPNAPPEIDKDSPEFRAAVEAETTRRIRERELDRVDRRYLRFPEAEISTAAGALARKVRGDELWSPAEGRLAMRAFGVWCKSVLMKTPIATLLGKDADPELVRAMSQGTSGDGAELVPDGFIPLLNKDEDHVPTLRGLVKNIPVDDASGKLPALIAGVTGAWDNELDSITESQAETDEVSYATHRLAGFTEVSRELAMNGRLDVVEMVMASFRDWIRQEQDRVIAIGSGSGKPVGIYSASGITDVAVTSLTFDNLVTLRESLSQIYHSKTTTRWVFGSRVKAALMKLKDDTGRPLLLSNPNMMGSVPMLLGTPCIVEESCPANFIFIGDMSRYLWFDRGKYAMESSLEANDAFRKHKIALKFTMHGDGKPVLPPNQVAMARSRLLTGT